LATSANPGGTTGRHGTTLDDVAPGPGSHNGLDPCALFSPSSVGLSRCLIIPLIIQTIRLDPSEPDAIDGSSHVSRPDPSGADQIDAEHQATDLVPVELWQLTVTMPRR
jgi:hypothetical protein